MKLLSCRIDRSSSEIEGTMMLSCLNIKKSVVKGSIYRLSSLLRTIVSIRSNVPIDATSGGAIGVARELR